MMTVGELIEALQSAPPSAEISMYTHGGQIRYSVVGIYYDNENSECQLDIEEVLLY